MERKIDRDDREAGRGSGIRHRQHLRAVSTQGVTEDDYRPAAGRLFSVGHGQQSVDFVAFGEIGSDVTAVISPRIQGTLYDQVTAGI